MKHQSGSEYFEAIGLSFVFFVTNHFVGKFWRDRLNTQKG